VEAEGLSIHNNFKLLGSFELRFGDGTRSNTGLLLCGRETPPLAIF
jgi:hypothetical protein